MAAIFPLPDADTKAFRKALQSSSQYVDSLKISFLRAFDYKVEEAAIRLIAFFRQKMMLFGQDCLVDDITQEDLNEGAMAATRKGLVQILQRDRSGRPVIYVSGQVNAMYKLEDVVSLKEKPAFGMNGNDILAMLLRTPPHSSHTYRVCIFSDYL